MSCERCKNWQSPQLFGEPEPPRWECPDCGRKNYTTAEPKLRRQNVISLDAKRRVVFKRAVLHCENAYRVLGMLHDINWRDAYNDAPEDEREPT